MADDDEVDKVSSRKSGFDSTGLAINPLPHEFVGSRVVWCQLLIDKALFD